MVSDQLLKETSVIFTSLSLNGVRLLFAAVQVVHWRFEEVLSCRGEKRAPVFVRALTQKVMPRKCKLFIDCVDATVSLFLNDNCPCFFVIDFLWRDFCNKFTSSVLMF